jgi:OOP family OmpA-OmpF porin
MKGSIMKKHINQTISCLSLVAAAVVPLAVQAEGVSLPAPRSYQDYLAQAYGSLAELERGDSTDMIDTRELSDRAVSAYHGNLVLPLAPTQVRLVQATPASIANDYAAIQRVTGDQNLISRNPKAVAMAQAYYDCYALQQQSEPNASHNMHTCEPGFRKLIAMLDKPEVAVVKQTVKHYRAVNSRTISFGWDKDTLDDASKRELDNVKSMLMQDGRMVRHVALEGYADRSGEADYNERLSERRAQAVADYLGVAPVNNEEVDMQAFGETNLPVPTADGVREPRNRVVRITVVEDAKTVSQTVENQPAQ